MVTAADVAGVVRAALLAPSGDNCQPWRFVWHDPDLDIYWVPDLAESLYDVDRAASWIALGAMLTNIRLAAGSTALSAAASVFPTGSTPNRVACVRLTRDGGLREPLAHALESRCVNRRPYASTPLSPDARAALVRAASAIPGVHLQLVEEPSARNRVAEAAASNDRLLFENRALHDGLFRWVRWTNEEAARSGDGLPAASLELGPLERPGFRLLGLWPFARAFAALGMTRLLPLRTHLCYRRSAAIGLLAVDGHRPEDFVRGGEALQRVWLTATAHEVAFQPITGITFLWLRVRLRGGEGLSAGHQRLIAEAARALEAVLPLFAHATPVMLFRLGYAGAPSGRAPRRPVEAVLSVETSP